MIFENVYAILDVFFPSTLLDIPFFEFLANLMFFAFCTWLFSIFFIFPIKCVFNWIKSHVKGGL